MGSNTEKKPWTNLQNLAKRLRATTKWGALEKSPILLSQYWKNEKLDGIIIILYLGVVMIF